MNLRHPIKLNPRGFTLIELLVVIGIIAILATIAVPAGQKVLQKARELQARTAMKGLELGIKGYQTEYNRLPALDSPAPIEDNADGYDTASEDGRGIIDILIAKNDLKNPRQIRFYDPPAAKGEAGYSESWGLRDTWGVNGYRIILDYNGDGRITDPYMTEGTDAISSSVLIYSAGTNKQFDLGATGPKIDDLKSWN